MKGKEVPCPLCLIGFKQPHSKRDWEILRTDPALKEKVREALKDYNTRVFKDGLK
jgi:hypothetical protein